MTIRDLRWTDYEDLKQNYLLCYEERDRGDPIWIHLLEEPPSDADETDWFSGLWKRTLSGREIVVVAEVDGRAVGSCAVTQRGPAAPSESSHVGDLGILVRRGHRGKGLGTQLLQEAIRRSRGRFSLLRLDVVAENRDAKRLYERFGFVSYGRLPKAIRRGSTLSDLESMYLELEKLRAREGSSVSGPTRAPNPHAEGPP